jgi:hypothetical protein
MIIVLLICVALWLFSRQRPSAPLSPGRFAARRESPPAFQNRLQAPQPSARAPLWPWAIVAVVVLCFVDVGDISDKFMQLVHPTPPLPAGAPDLTPVFAKSDHRSQAREHAMAFSAICNRVAAVIEYDGATKSPRIVNGVQADDFRRALREYRMDGWSFLRAYPDLGPAVEGHLTHALGTSGKPLDTEARAKWVTAMRQLSAGAEYAAHRL